MNKSYTDEVTGLPSFDTFSETVEADIKAHFSDTHFVYVSTDISNFKYINRIYGYQKANELLESLSKLMYDSDYGCRCACRTHSDHFIAFFSYEDSHAFEEYIERIDKSFSRKNARKFPSITLHLNNGLYFLNNPNESISLSFDKANVARRQSKGNYTVTSVHYADEMFGRGESDARVIATFDNALKNDNIAVLLQPKVDISSGELVGAEALSRLYDENGNLMYPDNFIPVLENSGKVVELDKYVLDVVCKTIKEWISKGYKVPPISVNLSRMHFYEKDMAQEIFRRFAKYKIPIEYIELELTESLFFADHEMIISEISKLRDYGFKISMDDFGVGYSTLNTLGTLPVDIIKFDKGFVRSSMGNDASFQIFKSLISVFNNINYEVICEGVETREQEKLIFECGCDTVQGFLYDRPIKIDVFEHKYLSDKNNKREGCCI